MILSPLFISLGSFILGMMIESYFVSRHLKRIPSPQEVARLILDTPYVPVPRDISDKAIKNAISLVREPHYRVSLINGPVEDCKYDGYDYDVVVKEWHKLEHSETEKGDKVLYKDGKIHSIIKVEK